MTDLVATIPLGLGLDEVTPDATVNPGAIRRSLQYEVVAEGGIRRIGGFRKWSGRDVTPEADAIEVVEVPPYFDTPFIRDYQTTTGTTFRILATIQRESSTLLVVEKRRATERFDTGDSFIDSGIRAIIDPRPRLTEIERARTFQSIDSYNRSDGVEVPNGGELVLIQPCEGAVFAARLADGVARFSRNIPPGEVPGEDGGWYLNGEIPDVGEGARFEATSYRFEGQAAAIFVVSGTTPPYRIRRRRGDFIYAVEQIDDGVDEHPTHVTVHRNHLFLAYPNGRILHSDLGDPMSFTAIGGGAELTVGAEITGFQALPGESLAIYCEDRISILSGSSAADWRIDLYSDAAGAIAGTLQNMPTAIFCDRRAITTLAASDAYGNFTSKALSQLFDPTFQRIRRGARLFSVVNRERSQYRIFNEDGRGLYLTFAGNRLAGAMEVDLGRRITCMAQLDGEEDRALFGGADGYVYQLDAGNTLDGETMDNAFFETADADYGRPRERKRFKQVAVDAFGDPRLRATVTNILDGGVDLHAEPAAVEIVDESRSAQRYRDDLLSRFAQRFTGLAYLLGTARSMAFRFVPASNHAHTLNALTVHFTRRGQKR